jgi:PAS domain S-box-containing protein
VHHRALHGPSAASRVHSLESFPVHKRKIRSSPPGNESIRSLTPTSSDTAAFGLRWYWSSLLLAVGFIIAGTLEVALVRATGAREAALVEWVLLPWAPLGIAVSVTMICGNARSWPGAFVGTLVVDAMTGLPATMILTQASAIALLTVVTFTLLRRWQFNPTIVRWQDSLVLWSVAAIAALVLATTGILGALASGWLEPSRLYNTVARHILDPGGHIVISRAVLEVAARWCLNWITGIALVVPFLYGVFRSREELARNRVTELSVLLLLTVAWVFCQFADVPWILRLPLGLIGLLLVTWPAIRFGATLTSLMTLVLAYATSAAMMFGHGPAGARPEEVLSNGWAFIIMAAVLGQVITSLLAERNAAARMQAASEARYRTLFELSPEPLWVQDRHNRRILMVNQAAVSRYGYSREQFAQLSATDLEAPHQRQALSLDRDAPNPDGGELLHRTADGEWISVEVRAQPIEFSGQEADLVFSHDVTDRNRLRTALLDSADRAERQLSRELHDGLGPDLAALSLFARALRTQVERGEMPGAGALETIEKVAQRAVATCRGIAHGLSALGETGGNLHQALRSLPERFQHDGPPTLDVNIQGESPITLPEATQHHILRIAQEAVANAVKHARAQHVLVIFENAPSAVTLTVLDDGIGLPPVSKLRVGLGRASMRYRASAIGGNLYIRNLSTGGTEVRLECAQRATSGKKPEAAASG